MLEEKILEIIKSQHITEQVDLQNLLSKNGYNIPQATLSRKLRKLNIAKISGKYTLVQSQFSMKPVILNIQVSESGIIVLTTYPGNASSLAYYIDHQNLENYPSQENSPILGTIAGDDTVMVIIRSKDELELALRMIG